MKIVKSKIIPFYRKDVDTDIIIPAQFLTTTSKKGLGRYAFERIKKMEENSVFENPKYSDSQILVSGSNFGCGSSREHAAWALFDMGIRVVIAPSFADIFKANALNNGILTIELGEVWVKKIIEMEIERDEYILEVDLERQKVFLKNGFEVDFEIDAYKKKCLIEEMDDLDYLLKNLSEIKFFKQGREEFLFFKLDEV